MTVNLFFREHPETGGVGIEVEYEDGMKLFTPEQIVACMLTKVKANDRSAENEMCRAA